MYISVSLVVSMTTPSICYKSQGMMVTRLYQFFVTAIKQLALLQWVAI